MPSVNTPRVVTVELIYQFSQVSCEQVFNVLCPAPATAADLSAIRNIFDNWHLNTLRNQQNGAVALSIIKLTARDGPGAPVEVYPLATPRGGLLGTGGMLPSTLAMVVRWVTGKSGRSYRGRTYHMGLNTANQLNVHQWTTGIVGAVQGAYNTLRTTLASNGYTLVVLSLYSGVDGNGRPIPRSVGLWTPVQSAVCQQRIASMRKRQIPVLS